MNPDVESFLQRARTGRLATTDENGEPYLVPFCYVVMDGAIYSSLDAKPKRVPLRALKRVKNLLERPAVGVVVDRWSEDWTQLAYVQIRGKAELIEGGIGYDEAIARLREKYPQYLAMTIEENPMIKIAPHSIVTWGTLSWD